MSGSVTLLQQKGKNSLAYDLVIENDYLNHFALNTEG